MKSPPSRAGRWLRGLRYRASPGLDYGRLRWYRDVTWTYRLTARCIMPVCLRLLARVSVQGLANVPLTGPVILAANHRDNLDGFLLLHVVPRQVHVAARADGFGTGALCALWRRLGAFPADAWGMRYALRLLADGGAVALFPQATISRDLASTSGAVGLLALHSGAPVVPVAITGTEAVHLGSLLRRRATISVRFGAPVTFARGGAGAPRSRVVTGDILRQIGALIGEELPASP